MPSIDTWTNKGYNTELSQDLNREFQRYQSARQKWARRALEYEMVVNNDVDGTGTQFTVDELKQIAERNGIPLSVNISVAFIEQLQAYLTSAKPSITVVPIGDASKEYAYIHREIINTILYENDFQSKQERAIFNMAVTGHGILFVTLGDFFKDSTFNVTIKCLNWRNVYFDPMSVEPDYQDSEKIFIVFPMLQSKAKKIYNLTDEDMKYAAASFDDYGASFPSMGVEWPIGTDQREIIYVYEIFEKVNATLNILENGKKTFDSPNGTMSDGKGEYQTIDGLRIVDSLNQTFIKRYLKVGNYVKSEQLMPINIYPIIVYSHTHNYSPYPYGIVHHFIDLQHTLNKAIALTIQNAQVGSNTGMIAAEGSIQNKSEFQKQMSTPGGIAEFTPDEKLPQGGVPIQKNPAPLSNAWYSLVQQLIKLTEYITGIYDLSMGNPENAPRTASATQSIQSQGIQRPKMYARRIDVSNQRLGEVLIQYYQAFAPEQNIMTLIGETEAYAQIETNVSAIIDKQTGETKQDQRGFDKVTLVKRLADQQVMTIVGDIKVGHYKTRFQSATDLPSSRAAAVEILQSLMSRMSNDNMAVVIAQAALRLMDYPEVDRVLKDTDVVNQLTSQLQQISMQMQQIQKENQQLKDENEKLQYEVKDAELTADIETKKAKLDLLMGEVEKWNKEAKASEKQNQNGQQQTPKEGEESNNNNEPIIQ